MTSMKDVDFRCDTEYGEKTRVRVQKTNRNRAIKYEFEGKIFTIKELLKDPRCEVSVPTLRKNIVSGIPLPEAFKKIPRDYSIGISKRDINLRTYPYDGKDLTARELFELPECVIPVFKQLQSRLNSTDFNAEEAILIPLGGKRSEFVSKGRNRGSSNDGNGKKLDFNDVMKMF